MIDIHCHILPGIDDGAQTMDASVEMAKIAAGEGISKIVATPHINENSPDFGVIMGRVAELNQRLGELSVPVDIFGGGEIVAGMPAEFVRQYSINSNGYVLIEFPHTHLPLSSESILNRYVAEGLKPVIAHPERNPSVIKNPGTLIALVNTTGAVVQITSASITGGFGRRIRLCSRYLLKKGIVHIIASDAHSPEFRPPVFSKGLEVAAKIIGRENARKLVYDNPEAVINGRKIPPVNL